MEDIIKQVIETRTEIAHHIDMYGQIVGAVHVISDTKEESTIFFFSKGMTYETSNFTIGNIQSSENQIRFVGLKMALFTMEGFPEFFLMTEESVSIKDTIEKTLKDLKYIPKLYITFSTSEKLILPYIKERPGYESYQNYLALLEEENKQVINIFDAAWKER